VFAMQVKAVNNLYGGHPTEAMRDLRAALSVAKERQLSSRTAVLSVKLSEAAFSVGDYESARRTFEQIVASEGGRDSITPQIGLARVYGRFGDFNTARTHADRALAMIQPGHQMELAPSVYEVMGELNYESGDAAAARAYFEKAASLWVDDLPDAASVEAKCYEGLLMALGGRSGEGQALLQTGLTQAAKMGRVYLETRCGAYLARLAVNDHRAPRALAILNGLPRVDETVVGPELVAEIRYWRARALAATHDPAAASEHSAANALLSKARASVPEEYRSRFDARADIQTISR